MRSNRFRESLRSDSALLNSIRPRCLAPAGATQSVESSADLVMNLTLVNSAGEQTRVAVSLTAIESQVNSNLDDLGNQLNALLSAQLTQAGLAADAVRSLLYEEGP